MKAGVVGAGIMGQLMAFHLLNAGWEVTMFDKSNKDNCSHAAAGLLAPLAELEKSGRIIYAMGVAALNAHWPQLLSVLQDNIYFRHVGSLLLSHPQDFPELQRLANLLATQFDAAHAFQWLDSDAISELEPELQKFSRGLFFANEGQIDSQHVMRALTNYLNEQGAMMFHADVIDIQPGCITLQNQTCNFDLVFDCRGLGAKQKFPQLRGVRGELVWLHASDVQITRPIRFLHPRYGLYLVPRPEQIYLLGASEIEAEDHSPMSVRTMLELLTAANCVHANLLEARILKTVVQCRPALANHHPEIRVQEGMIEINGLYRHGFLIAPVIAHEVMRWIQEGKNNPEYQQLWESAA